MHKIDKVQIRLNLLRNKFHDDREKLNDFAHFVEKSLVKESQRWAERAEQEIVGITDEFELGFLTECYAEDISNFEKIFPQIQRYALFTHTMALAEANMVRLCRVVQDLSQTSTKFNRRSSGVILRGAKYITEHATTQSIRFENKIQMVDNLIKIRNRITHSEGIVKGKPNEEKIRDFVSQIPIVSIDQYNQIIMENGFINIAIHATCELLICLHDLVRKDRKRGG